MITVNVGRTFLKAWNQKQEKQLTAKEFFEQEYFELFFNHSKYLIWPTNSEFVQGITTFQNGLIGIKIRDKEGKQLKFDIKDNAIRYLNEMRFIENEIAEVLKEKNKNSFFIAKTLNSIERAELHSNFKEKVSTQIKSQEIDYSTLIGYSASEKEEFATTSGLITDLTLLYDEEEIYLSWIGSGLSLGVSGGLSILFDHPEILYKTYEGWKVYREFLNDPTLDKLAGNKITSWNGQWLNYAFSNIYRDHHDFATLDNLGIFKHDKTETVIETVKWSKLFFNLSNQYPDQTFTGYVFGFGQMNKTMGFYPFRFQQARKLISFYKILFGENAAFTDLSKYEDMYGIHIKRACELGALGIQALEPEGLRKFFDADKMPNLSKSQVSRKGNQSDEDFEIAVKDAEQKDYENKIIPFRIYKTWLLAMITKNKEELSDYTQQVAKALFEYRAISQKNKSGSTKAANTISNLLSAKSKKGFIETLTEIITDLKPENETLTVYKGLRDYVHLMTNEDFGYFVVLLKFDYAYQERVS